MELITTWKKMVVNGVVFRSEYLQRLMYVAKALNESTVRLVHYKENKAHLFEVGRIIVLIMPAFLDQDNGERITDFKKLEVSK